MIQGVKRFLKKRKNNKWYVKLSAAFIGLLLIESLAFTAFCLFRGSKEYADIVAVLLNAIVAVLGFFAIFASVTNDKKAKQFEFFADYNFNFLTNSEFITVERMLESCNQKYECINAQCDGRWEPEQEKEFQNFCDSVFGTVEYKYVDEPNAKNTRIDDHNLICNEYQNIVNYLVYLEAFVPLILNEQLHLEEVDDLYGYRFFIAMNNPVLQEMELFREKPYYRGCFKAYKEWIDYRTHDPQGRVIPMEHYNLLKGWNKYKKDHKEAKE